MAIDLEQLKSLMQYFPTLKETASYFKVKANEIESFVREKTSMSFDEFQEYHSNVTRLKFKEIAIKKAIEGNFQNLQLCLEILVGWSKTVNVNLPKQTTIKLAYSLDEPIDVTPSSDVGGIKDETQSEEKSS